MADKAPIRFKTICEYHRYLGLPGPVHPLISILPFERVAGPRHEPPATLAFDFYSVSLKRNCDARMRYGQQDYDFDSGILFFMAPGQVFSIAGTGAPQHTGWLLLVHPDFLWGAQLAHKIRQYEYFDYAVHEALHLSDREEATITGLMQDMADESRANIDRFSKEVAVAQLELLLTYADRFYHRQFITRQQSSHKLLTALEAVLDECFSGRNGVAGEGLPTVQQVAGRLNVSPDYLSSTLKVLTGQNTQQHIHERLIQKAKERLSTTGLSVSEIAYGLGFEHPQSFSKLFKLKTSLSPLAFRQSFN